MNSENPQQDSPAQATAPPKTKASSQPAGSKRAKRPKQQQQQQAGAGGSSGGGGGAAGQQKLKIVVRRLPPNIPEDIFWTSTEQWVNDETAGWRSFRRGKVAKSSVLSLSSTSRPGLYPRLTASSFGSQLQGEQGVDALEGVHPLQEPGRSPRLSSIVRRTSLQGQNRCVSLASSSPARRT